MLKAPQHYYTVHHPPKIGLNTLQIVPYGSKLHYNPISEKN